MSQSDVSGAKTSLAGGLVVKGLKVTLERPGADVDIVAGVDLELGPGRRMGLVGESGSGKSVTANAIMGLSDLPLSSSASSMMFGELDLLKLTHRRWRETRGPVLSLIQQDPLASLSPVFTVGSQVMEPIRRHLGLSRSSARREAIEKLTEVGIPDASRRALDYPHQLSGGLRQRVAIAVALAARPSIVLADEPTTALDVTVQAQILDLMRRLSDEHETAIMFITHDLALLPGFVHDVTVMYSGRVVEVGAVGPVLSEPRHPYTAALVAAQPGNAPGAQKRKLLTIPGAPPSPSARPPGCAFAPRCPLAVQHCREERPELRPLDGRLVACHRAELMTSSRRTQ